MFHQFRQAATCISVIKYPKTRSPRDSSLDIENAARKRAVAVSVTTMTLLLDSYLSPPPPPPPLPPSDPLSAPYCQHPAVSTSLPAPYYRQGYIAVSDYQRCYYLQGLRHSDRVENNYYRLLVMALKVALKASFRGLTPGAITPVQLRYRSVLSVTARRR